MPQEQYPELKLLEEPQSYITKFSFQRDEEVDERTRVDSYEELVFLNRQCVLGRILKVPVYQVISRSWMHLKISKDGTSREEAVRSLQATNEMQRGFKSGLRIVSEAIDDQGVPSG